MNRVLENSIKSIDELIQKYEVEAYVSRYNMRYLDTLCIAKSLINAINGDGLTEYAKENLFPSLEEYTECVNSPLKDNLLSDIRRRVEKMPLITCELCDNFHKGECKCVVKAESPDKVKFCKNFKSLFGDADLSIQKYSDDLKYICDMMDDEGRPEAIEKMLFTAKDVYDVFFDTSAEHIANSGCISTLDEIIAEKKKELGDNL